MGKLLKSMAEEAAKEIAEKAYGKKIKDIEDSVKNLVDKLIEKYIPKPVLDCQKEFPEFINYTTYICLRIIDDDSYTSCYVRSNAKSTVECLYVTKKEYNVVKSERRRYEDTIKEKEKYEKSLVTALMILRTEKRISEQFPEALPYLNFSGETLPSINIQPLRDILNRL